MMSKIDMYIPVFVYFILILAYVAIRPTLSYNDDGTMKSFGVGENHTLFPLWVISILIAVMVSFTYAFTIV
jgi:hypothetical protein